MLEMKVTIAAADLAAAINNLAAAIDGRNTAAAARANTQTSVIPDPVIPEPVVPSVTEHNAAPTVDQATAAVTPAAPAPTPTPAVPAPAIPVTTAPVYTLDQIAKAGASLVDAGKMEQLLALLAKHGVQAVTQIQPDQYGAFATELRALGAQI